MRKTLVIPLCATLLLLLGGCSRTDEERTGDKIRAVDHRLNRDAHTLGSEAKKGVARLNASVQAALNQAHPVIARDTESAEHKLRRGARQLRNAAAEARAKLDGR
jgi:hypothetical protein